jgi:hypothetical protein
MGSAETKPRGRSRIGVAAVPVAFLLIPLLLWSVVGYTYSEGDRVGFVEGVFEEGTVCHTYEGALLMGATPTSPGKTWSFSVRNKHVADEIAAFHGQKVALQYHQDKGGLSTCFRQTEYVVTGVRKIN